jgi:hypothetical protein
MAYGVVHQFPGGTKNSTGRRSQQSIRAMAASARARPFMQPDLRRTAGRSSRSTSRRKAGSASVTRPHVTSTIDPKRALDRGPISATTASVGNALRR